MLLLSLYGSTWPRRKCAKHLSQNWSCISLQGMNIFDHMARIAECRESYKHNHDTNPGDLDARD